MTEHYIIGSALAKPVQIACGITEFSAATNDIKAVTCRACLLTKIERLELEFLQAGRLEHELNAIIADRDAEIERLKVKLVMAERWLSSMNSAWGLDDDDDDDFGVENPPPVCGVCGTSLLAVSPGKWQCPKCE